MKEDAQTKDIPVIMLTALISKEEQDRCVKFGLNACMAKPFDDEELLAKVNPVFSLICT